MFVVLIIVPLLVLYFFIKTKNEKKENYEKWIHIGEVSEDVLLRGTIQHFTIRKERFYQEKMIYTYDIHIKSGKRNVKIKKSEPITSPDQSSLPLFVGGDILCKGQWYDKTFIANDISLSTNGI